MLAAGRMSHAMTTEALNQPRRSDHRLFGSPLPLPTSLLWWMPIGVAIVYALIVAPDLPDIVHRVWLSSDTDAAGVFGQLYHSATAGTHITLGNHGWYEEAAYYVLTYYLPAHRLLWYATPEICCGAMLAILAITAGRTFGRWSGAIVAAALLCVGKVGMATLFETNAHGTSVLHVTVLCAAVVYVLPRIQLLSRWRLAAIAIALGLVSGLPLAGDDLFLSWGVAPFALAVGIAAWRGPQAAIVRTIAFGALTLVATAASAAVFAKIMQDAGFGVNVTVERGLLTFTRPIGLITNLARSAEAIPYYFGGIFFGRPTTRGADAGFLTATLVFAALVAALFAARQRVQQAGPRPVGGARQLDPRTVYVTFWVTCMLAGWVMYLVAFTGPALDARYLLGPIVAIPALLPLLAQRGLGWRLSTTAGVTLLALTAIARFAEATVVINPRAPSLADARAVTTYARREHVRLGYAGYWTSLDLMWNSDFRLHVYAVRRCRVAGEPSVCRVLGTSMSDWYIPRSGIRTLFIRNPGITPELLRPDALWGRPIATKRIGSMTVYIYDDDIARLFGRTRPHYRAGGAARLRQRRRDRPAEAVPDGRRHTMAASQGSAEQRYVDLPHPHRPGPDRRGAHPHGDLDDPRARPMPGLAHAHPPRRPAGAAVEQALARL